MPYWTALLDVVEEESEKMNSQSQNNQATTSTEMTNATVVVSPVLVNAAVSVADNRPTARISCSAATPPPAKKKRLACCASENTNRNPIPETSSFVSSLTNLLWGQSLPPHQVIAAVKSGWTAGWHVLMDQMGPTDSAGSYNRPASKFWFGRPDYPVAASAARLGKLHLYVGLPCPWAHRTLIVRALKGLENHVILSVATPGEEDGSWKFISAAPPPRSSTSTKLVPTSDKANGCGTLREIYSLRRGGYNGRATVPLLWDSGRNDVVCNESNDIVAFFNYVGDPAVDLAPPSLADAIEKWNGLIYPRLNNGVYRCGFAQTQAAYDEAVGGVFETLDIIDDHLSKSRFLCGGDLTIADVYLFTTLIRFDVVYNTLFKCTRKRLIDYTYLYSYVRDIYQIPSVAKTCNLDAVMDGYYKTLFPLNAGGIRPVMPAHCEEEELMKPHNRG